MAISLLLIVTNLFAVAISGAPVATQESALTATENDAVAQSPAGRPVIEDFALSDSQGKRYALSDFADAPAVVVVFLGNECPLARLYAPRLVELAEQFRPRGVVFLGINSNRQDSLREIEQFAINYQLSFPMLKDPENEVADLFSAIRTPEAFLLDQQREIRYRGQIDDQYGIVGPANFKRTEPKRRHLALAIEQLLDGKTIDVPETVAYGCHIGRLRTPRAESPVTWSDQIAPLFFRSCQPCHRPGEIAPFPLMSYSDVLGWEGMIQEVVQERRMPPWHANPSYGHFVNDRRLSDEDVALIDTWVENGAPLGEPEVAESAPVDEPVVWTIGEPDLIVSMSDEPFLVPAEGIVQYQHFLVDPKLEEDVWVAAAQCQPGAPAVVHHIDVFAFPPDVEPDPASPNIFRYLLWGKTPGERPIELPKGVAIRLQAGSKFLFQMHYTPCGEAQLDRSQIGIRFADPETVTLPMHFVIVPNFHFEIPPYTDNYLVESEYSIPQDARLLILNPHLHLRGKSFRFEAFYPDGRQEVLLDVPRYDFEWQTHYVLAEPKLLPRGTRIHCTALFDNSTGNLSNPDPSRKVRWGDQTWEEMMLGALAVIPVQDDPNWVFHSTAGQSSRMKYAWVVGVCLLATTIGFWGWRRAR